MAQVTPPRPAGSLRLLVAEDEPHIRRILVTILETAGFRVDVVHSGVEAMERLEGPNPYDMVLTDLLMPELNGLELLEGIRGLPSRQGLPVIVLTAKGQDADRTRAFALGAADFVTKPFSPRKLLKRVDEILGQS
jgi:CheY-like chemotaxis protein